jgi:nucleoside-diphosphate-sugar epimerase
MEKIKNILVTGASGKIGRRLVPSLVKAGCKVRAVQFKTPLSFSGAELVRGDISDGKFAREILEDMDAVCHLATCKEDRDNFLNVSVRGTFNLLDGCRGRGGVKRFILAGGDASLGIFFYPNPYPLSESAPLRAYPGYYAFSKVLEETMVSQYHIQYGLPSCILRFSWIQDEDDILAYMTFRPPNFGGPAWRDIASTAEQKRFFENDLDGVGCLLHKDGKPFVRHVVGVMDVVQAFHLALERPQSCGQTFNIASTAPFSYDVLSKYIADKLGLPVVSFELGDFHDFSIDISKARSTLGYAPEYDIFKIVDAAIDFRRSGGKRSESKYSG